MSRKIVYLGGLGVLVVAALIAVVLARPDTGPPETAAIDARPAPPPVEVTAVELYKAYQENAALAGTHITNRSVIVSGSLVSVGRDLGGAAYLNLDVGEDLQWVQCYLAMPEPERAMSLPGGQEVRLRGTVMGGAPTGVLVRECVLLE